MPSTAPFLDALLAPRLSSAGAAWVRSSLEEIADGVPGARLASLISMASRHAPRGPLAPTEEERRRAHESLAGWNPERWTSLEAVRVRLIVAHPERTDASFPGVLEECFRYADAGELTALYRSLAHLPAGERFVWRAGEGCRTNMRTVFEATACDTPYPAAYFDELAWCQLAIKAVFIEAPLWRVYGLDQRLSPDLARMALDLADERRSAGRSIPPDLWLCLGAHGGDRGRAALEREAQASDPRLRAGAALALGRAGADDTLRAWLDRERDDFVRCRIEEALAGGCEQAAFAIFDAGR